MMVKLPFFMKKMVLGVQPRPLPFRPQIITFIHFIKEGVHIGQHVLFSFYFWYFFLKDTFRVPGRTMRRSSGLNFKNFFPVISSIFFSWNPLYIVGTGKNYEIEFRFDLQVFFLCFSPFIFHIFSWKPLYIVGAGENYEIEFRFNLQVFFSFYFSYLFLKATVHCRGRGELWDRVQV